MNTNRGSYIACAALGSAFVLALGTDAIADGYEMPALKGGYEVPPPPSDRHIYVKGYVGQANTQVDDMWNEVYPTNQFTIYNHDMKSSTLWGLGIGYKRNHWLRFDLTGEYRGDALFVGADSYLGGFGFTGGTNEFTADVKSWLGLANAYWDICTIHGLTPYLGAGIGFSTLTVDGLKDVNVPQNSFFFGATHTQTNFAWALYAGLAFDITPQFVVDLGYRYANLGDARSGVVTAYDFSDSYASHQLQDLTSNDLLLAVRYKLQRDEPVAYAVK
jgi:opacity protein-like surface antigen